MTEAQASMTAIPSTRSADHDFAIALARAFGGATFFALPLLMTMEMWSLGFSVPPLRLALLLVVLVPVLVGLTHYAGFEETHDLQEDIRDAFVALFVGFVAASIILLLLGIIDLQTALPALTGQIMLETVPASVGAALAVSLLGGEQEKQREQQSRRSIGYGGELFLMMAGAIFFAFNLAPTEEMVLIAMKMGTWHMLATAVASVLLMHAFVYAVEFRGQETPARGHSQWSVFCRFTVVGYAISLLVSAYVLWTFGRYDGSSAEYQVATAIVLGFPASLGASAARLVL